jgi:hypothetical protein
VALELNTYGDLKKVLKAISLKQKGEKVVSKGKEIAVDTFLSLIPGAGAAKTALDIMSAFYKSPDSKKTSSWLDNLNIDDNFSKIIDDTVENGFLQVLYNTIEQNSNDKPLEADFDLNEKLKEYLKKHYAGRTVTGISESKKKRLSEQEGDEEYKNILSTLEDAIKSTKEDIKNANEKKNELSRILAVKKDSVDRNYISAKIKQKSDEINKKMNFQKNQEANLKKQQDIMAKSKSKVTEKEVELEEKFVPKKTLKVIFDKSTGKPWEVSFTDRGFQIGETRLSFENIENAIDKNFNIILDAGNGLVLDQNKLNKILKYKGKV